MASVENRAAGQSRNHAKTKVQTFRDQSSTLHPALGNYFNKRQFSDLTVVAPDARKLYCHQIILCSASKRFAETLEQGPLHSEELPVWGVDSEALETVIRFFYTGECQLTFHSLVPILDTAQRLEVPSVTAACENFILEVLAPNTVCTLLRNANQYKCEDLVEQCMALIRRRFEEVICDEDFLSVDFGTLMQILTANQSTQSDVTLFRGAWFWAVADPSHVQYLPEVLKVVKTTNVSITDLLKSMPLMGSEAALLAQQLQDGIRRSPLSLAQPGKDGDLSGSAAGAPAAGMQGMPAMQLLQHSLMGGSSSHPLPFSLAPVSGTELSTGLDLEELRATLQRGLPSALQAGSDGMGRPSPLRLPTSGSPPPGEEGHSVPTTSTESTPHEHDGMMEHGHGGRRDGDTSSMMELGGGMGRDGMDERRSLTLTKPLGGSRRLSPDRQARLMSQVSLGDRVGTSGRYSKGVCQVDGCYTDLSSLRDYHLRYKICEYHLKVSSIMREGRPQRFCQQCGRFHNLVEFDGNKRSCRARLQRHNERRRKRPDGEMDPDSTESPVPQQQPRLTYLPRTSDGHMAQLTAPPAPPSHHRQLEPPMPRSSPVVLMPPAPAGALPGQPEGATGRPGPTWGLQMLADAAQEDHGKKLGAPRSPESEQDMRMDQAGGWGERPQRPAGMPGSPTARGMSDGNGRRGPTGVGQEDPSGGAGGDGDGHEGPGGGAFGPGSSNFVGMRLLNVLQNGMPFGHMP